MRAQVVNLDARSQTSGVTSGTEKLLEDALALLKEEREALVEALRDSLDPETVEVSNASRVPIVASNAHSGVDRDDLVALSLHVVRELPANLVADVV